jgi:aryl-alcohol dehydrogenase-like predicted oxidoreductase
VRNFATPERRISSRSQSRQDHRPDPDTPFEEAVRAFAEMKDADQVRHVGLSNVAASRVELTDDHLARVRKVDPQE